jgi:hypothetical protein
LITIVKIKYGVLTLLLVALSYFWLTLFRGPHTYAYHATSGTTITSPTGVSTTYYPWNHTIHELKEDLNAECWLPFGCGIHWLTHLITNRRFANVDVYQDTLEKAYACKSWSYPASGTTTDPVAALEDLQASFPTGIATKIASDGIEIRLGAQVSIVDACGHILVGCTAAQQSDFNPNAMH